MLENFEQLTSCKQTDSVMIYSILNPVNQPYLQVPKELTYLHYDLCALTVAISAAATLDKHPLAGCGLGELMWKKKEISAFIADVFSWSSRHSVTAVDMSQSERPTFHTLNTVTFLHKHTASISFRSKLYPCFLPFWTPSHFTEHPPPRLILPPIVSSSFFWSWLSHIYMSYLLCIISVLFSYLN